MTSNKKTVWYVKVGCTIVTSTALFGCLQRFEITLKAKHSKFNHMALIRLKAIQIASQSHRNSFKTAVALSSVHTSAFKLNFKPWLKLSRCIKIHASSPEKLIKMLLIGNVKESEKELLDVSLYVDLHQNNSVSAVETFRFLGSFISQDLKWAPNVDSITKKAQQRMYFRGQIRKFNLPQELLTQCYMAIVQSDLCTFIIVWFGSATKQDWNRLKRTIRTAGKYHWC